jgi:hypothetical protein
LADFQDDSCGFEQTYGLNSFQGRATLVALFNAGCGYCQSQARNLDRMRLELEGMNVPAYFAAINGDSYVDYQDRIVEQCALPFFQDTEADGAMTSMGGAIYDIYVYGPDGRLHVFFSGDGDLDTYLADDPGYENVREALVSAAQGVAYVPPHPPVEIVIPDGGIPDNADQGND